MYDTHTHSVPDHIVSLSQPWLRPIVRGKANNEACNLTEMIEHYRARTDRYPERVLAEKIYRNREDFSCCAARPALGCPRKDEKQDKNGIIRIR